MDNLVMEIKDYHSINEAKIEINNINVIAGVNGSGKSTLSRILYSFLKGNSNKRKEIAIQSIVEDINRIIDSLNYDGNEYGLPNHLKVDDDYRYIKDTYHRILKISKKHDKYAKMKHFELINEIAECSNELLNKLKHEDIDVNKKIEEYNKKMIEYHENRIVELKKDLGNLNDSAEKDRINKELLHWQEIYDRLVISNQEHVFNEIIIDKDAFEKSIDTILKKTSEGKYDDELIEANQTFHNFNMKSIHVSGSNLNKLEIIESILEEMLPVIPKSEGMRSDSKLNKVMKSMFPSEFDKDLPVDYNLVNLKLSKEIEQYLNDFHKILGLYDMKRDYFNLLEWLFGDCLVINDIFNILDKNNIDLSFECHKFILEKEFLGYGVREKFFRNSSDSIEDVYKYFFNNGFINGVYYVDNVSIFDLNSDGIFFNQLFHVNEIIEDLFKLKYREDTHELNQNVEKILEKIERIIQGRYEYSGYKFETDKMEVIKESNEFPSEFDESNSERKISTWNFDTPSGIKQIGIIQLLLLNNKLKKDGYLIIDEPEVNLHPDWQFKLAEILVLLAKDLNITIYLNSHSPFFVEAMDAFTEFYDVPEEINYYLAEESEVEGKYDFIKIESDELYKIYDNLGRPYDLIDQLRLQKHLGE